MASDTKTTSSTLLDAQGQVIQEAAYKFQATGDQIVDSIRRQPLTAALIIFAVGYILGKIT